VRPMTKPEPCSLDDRYLVCSLTCFFHASITQQLDVFHYLQSYPTVVVYANTTEDVVRAVRCSWKFGYSVSAAGRRHSFQGWSVVSGSVTIDMSNMCPPPVVNSSTMTATVGAGCTNAVLLHAVSQSGIPDAMSVIGSCPSVGLVGYILGGGMGDITPYVGLACDQVLELEIVLWNGTVVRANNKTHQDLFWASCGGGPGFGVVTRMVIKIHKAPNPGHYAVIDLAYKLDGIPDVMDRFQKFINSGKEEVRKYGGNAFTLSTPIPFYVIQFVYLGSWTQGLQELETAGLLDPNLLIAIPADVRVNYSTIQGPFNISNFTIIAADGYRVREFPTYAEVEAFVICSFLQPPTFMGLTCENLGINNCTGLVNCDTKQTLDAVIREGGDPFSPLNTGASSVYRNESSKVEWVNSGLGGIMITDMPKAVWSQLTELYKTTIQNENLSGCAASIGIYHLSHGAVADIKTNQTAYPWRNQSLLFTYGLLTAAVAPGVAPLCQRDWVSKVTDILIEHFGPGVDNLKGYYNYMGMLRTDWQRFYFGDNYQRLQRIKACYDPLDVFTKPFTVTASNTCSIEY
jgi:hypothetical protein